MKSTGLVLSLIFVLTGCELPIGSGLPIPGPSSSDGGGTNTGETPTLPTPNPSPSSPVNSSYPSCLSSDSQVQCMGVKLVSFTDSIQSPVITETQSIELINRMNQVWSECKIQFQLEKYEAVDPISKNLEYDVNWSYDGDTVREAFQEPQSLLVVAVGSLASNTIAVTQMPWYNGPLGVLVEKDYSQNAYTVGHEMGHYFGLYHIRNSSNLMNAYIGPNTSDVSTNQCNIARNTIQDYLGNQRRISNSI